VPHHVFAVRVERLANAHRKLTSELKAVIAELPPLRHAFSNLNASKRRRRMEGT
jgi:hypothetical protein